MREVLNFITMLAIGLVALIALSGIDPLAGSRGGEIAGLAGRLDYASFLTGFAVALVLTRIAALPWAELPRGLARRLIEHRGALQAVIVVAACSLFLVYA